MPISHTGSLVGDTTNSHQWWSLHSFSKSKHVDAPSVGLLKSLVQKMEVFSYFWKYAASHANGIKN